MQPKLLSLSPSQLRANPWNTNVVSPENEAKLDESIRRNGFFKPVIVREIDEMLLTAPPQAVYEVIGGEHRWQSGIRLGMAEIPVVNLGKISDDKAKEISIIDNARYGDDDMVSYAALLKDLGGVSELQDFLPYSDDDFAVIFSSSDIALDDLEIDESFEKEQESQPDNEPPAVRAPKTHTIMRFKVSNQDAARITGLVAKTQKAQGLTGSDELTNAGDALVHLLVGQFTADSSSAPVIDEIEALLEEATA